MSSNDPARGSFPTEATWADETEFASSVESEEEQQKLPEKTTFEVQLGSTNNVAVEEGATTHSSDQACTQTDRPSETAGDVPSDRARMRTDHDGTLRRKSVREREQKSQRKNPRKLLVKTSC